MEYFEARRLGMLHQQLGLDPKTRVFLQMPTKAEPAVFIWNLEAGNTYKVTLATPPSVIRGQREVPSSTKQIIGATTDDLKRRWVSTSGWDDDRSSIFSELTIRGVRILDLDLGLDRPAFDAPPKRKR